MADVEFTVWGMARTEGAKRHARGTAEAVDDYIAHTQKGLIPVLRAEQERLYRMAQGNHARHDKPGGSRITKSHGYIDRYVSLDDSKGDEAAGAIESRLFILRSLLTR